MDLVVIAAGIRPRSQLAADCGLTRAGDGGIVVDDFLRTSDPAICAIGECASHRSRTYGLLSPGYAMAELVLEGLAGMVPPSAMREVAADVRAQLDRPADP